MHSPFRSAPPLTVTSANQRLSSRQDDRHPYRELPKPSILSRKIPSRISLDSSNLTSTSVVFLHVENIFVCLTFNPIFSLSPLRKLSCVTLGLTVVRANVLDLRRSTHTKSKIRIIYTVDLDTEFLLSQVTVPLVTAMKPGRRDKQVRPESSNSPKIVDVQPGSWNRVVTNPAE
jgi:hypothetical protein